MPTPSAIQPPAANGSVSGWRRVASSALAFVPGVQAAQYVAGRNFLTGESIRRSSALQGALAGASLLPFAFLGRIRGTRAGAPGHVRRADIRAIHTGTNAPADATEGLIRTARGELRAEIRKLDDPVMTEALRGHVASGGRVRVLADRHFHGPGARHRIADDPITAIDGSPDRARFHAHMYGPEKGFVQYVHGKTASTRERAVVSTAAMDVESRFKSEIAVELTGRSARLVHLLTRAAIHAESTGDAARYRKVAEQARREGVLVNDASQGIRHLGATMQDLPRSARRGDRLYVLWKEQRDPQLTQQLVAAHRRGVKLDIRVNGVGGETRRVANTNVTAEGDLALLRAAGIRITGTRPSEDFAYAHGNVLALQRRLTGKVTAYVGSAYGWTPMLRATEARDVGLLLRGRPAAQVLRRQLEMIESGKTMQI